VTARGACLRRVGLAVSAMLAFAAPSAAQMLPLPVGARVRVWNEADRLAGVLSARGVVLSVSPDTLVITEEWSQSPQVIPLSSITRIDVSRGIIPRRQGILRGARRGLVVGLALTPLLVLERRNDGDGARDWLDNVATSAAIMSAHGIAVGGFLGTTLQHTLWERLPLEIVPPAADSTPPPSP
jgi:hypothetical protein